MNGWKTYLAAILSILYGIGFCGIYQSNWSEAITYILAGMAVLGFRSALTKIITKQ